MLYTTQTFCIKLQLKTILRMSHYTCRIEDLQVGINEQELVTNYEYLIFENNHSITEHRKYVHIPLRDMNFLYLSSTL